LSLSVAAGGKPTGASQKGPASKPVTSSGRPIRSTRNHVQNQDRLNLERMSSGSFMNLIGEGPSTAAVCVNQDLKRSRKSEDEMKIQMLLNINNCAIDADGVDVNATSDDENNIVNYENGVVLERKEETAKEVTTDKLVVNNKKTAENSVNVPQQSEISKKLEQDAHKQVETPMESGKDKQQAVKGSDVKSNTNPEEEQYGISRSGNQEASTSLLDATIPLFVDTESQTDESYLLCTCIKCKGNLFLSCLDVQHSF